MEEIHRQEDILHAGALLYSLAAGLGEMLVLGVLYGLSLKPTV
jgi:hypothetical protein